MELGGDGAERRWGCEEMVQRRDELRVNNIVSCCIKC